MILRAGPNYWMSDYACRQEAGGERSALRGLHGFDLDATWTAATGCGGRRVYGCDLDRGHAYRDDIRHRRRLGRDGPGQIHLQHRRHRIDRYVLGIGPTLIAAPPIGTFAICAFAIIAFPIRTAVDIAGALTVFRILPLLTIARLCAIRRLLILGVAIRTIIAAFSLVSVAAILHFRLRPVGGVLLGPTVLLIAPILLPPVLLAPILLARVRVAVFVLTVFLLAPILTATILAPVLTIEVAARGLPVTLLVAGKLVAPPHPRRLHRPARDNPGRSGPRGDSADFDRRHSAVAAAPEPLR